MSPILKKNQEKLLEVSVKAVRSVNKGNKNPNISLYIYIYIYIVTFLWKVALQASFFHFLSPGI